MSTGLATASDFLFSEFAQAAGAGDRTRAAILLGLAVEAAPDDTRLRSLLERAAPVWRALRGVEPAAAGGFGAARGWIGPTRPGRGWSVRGGADMVGYPLPPLPDGPARIADDGWQPTTARARSRADARPQQARGPGGSRQREATTGAARWLLIVLGAGAIGGLVLDVGSAAGPLRTAVDRARHWTARHWRVHTRPTVLDRAERALQAGDAATALALADAVLESDFPESALRAHAEAIRGRALIGLGRVDAGVAALVRAARIGSAVEPAWPIVLELAAIPGPAAATGAADAALAAWAGGASPDRTAEVVRLLERAGRGAEAERVLRWSELLPATRDNLR